MEKKYYIMNGNGKFFLNLCGHYSLVKKMDDATCWDEPTHKEMWFYVHELESSTNKKWNVIGSDGYVVMEEPEEARKFIITLAHTIENEEREVVIEKESFGETFAGKKFIPQKVWYYPLWLKGTVKYIPVAEVDGKYYRYKNSVRNMNDANYNDNMWLW